ncbi:MAG: glycerol-3-phosphate 1-O-acyltransferase PlsY [Flavobacteriales bacterium]|nr:glycerol-3-phosphate 1-O-acyltransferase PlsY [Flavobacteriales bacterium]
MDQAINFWFLLFAYLLGSIPTSVWLGKIRYGVDVREYGSGNSGATNTFRVLGKNIGIPVLFVDVFKGWMAVKLGVFVFDMSQPEQLVNFQLLLGLVALIGHIFPIYVGFRGGKGIATLLGLVIAIHPAAAVISLLVFIMVLISTKYVSLSSIMATLFFPISVILVFKETIPSLMIFSVLVPVLVILTHHKNIKRLINRKESKVAFDRGKNDNK